MKKLLTIALIGLFAFASSAQITTPRFGTTPNKDNTGRVLTYAYVAPVYASTYTVVANAYETTVKMGTLTGAQTISATVTNCHVTDILHLLFTADGTNRIVTYSTGFSTVENDTVQAGTSSYQNFVFNGTSWVRLSGQNVVRGLTGDGTVSLPSIGFSSDPDNGFYRIGANNYGASVAGSKVVDYATSGITITGALSSTTQKVPTITRTGTAINTTATVTAAQLAGGLLTSTSAAAVTMTLPTATAMASQIGATQGTTFDFVVDNSAGANTVTVAVGSGIVASGFPGTNTLTLANSATIGTAVFRLTFISTTAATLARIN